ncbi:Cysteine-rich secretory protein family protein [Formosa sp. Hel1_31_208]|uniref:CAP domain-containing protein n=1 Tax=Formosa sp. Hel1_31_208 TaxID=1798225 RepID=UPI000879CCBC|nr:CAP domain-containing protein [Formosa sp. Hel1_31_208]SDS28700.1 Cysteine-rich secretory protein family protein [Formosa sp. Hel1_31_208]
MKPIKLLPIMVLVALLTFSCSTEKFPDETINSMSLPSAPSAKAIEIEILELINAHRITEGLTPLNNHDVIKSVAFTHTDYMVEVDNVSHDNFFQRKNSLIENTSAINVSENVAYAFSSAESVVNAWLNSDGHRENIEGDYTDFDVSAEQNAEGKWYFTNIFIKK